MTEYDELRAKITRSIRWSQVRVALGAFLVAIGIDMADVRRFAQLHVDKMLTEKLPKMTLPWWLSPMRSRMEPWLRSMATEMVGEFVDVYFTRWKTMGS